MKRVPDDQRGEDVPAAPDWFAERRLWAKIKTTATPLLEKVSHLLGGRGLPTNDAIVAIKQAWEEEQEKVQAKAHVSRPIEWEQRCKNEKSKKACHKTVKAPGAAPSVFVDRTDGTKTANVMERLRVLFEAWFLIFNSYGAKDLPQWDHLHQKYAEQIKGRGRPIKVPRLTGHRLRQKMCATPNGKAGGLDAWDVRMLKRLPLEWWNRVAAMLQAVEDGGEWPTAHTQGYLAFISKGKGDSALEQRPLTILTLIYRVRACVRLEDLHQWVPTWLDDRCSASAGRSPQDVWHRVSMLLEGYRERRCPTGGIAFDFAKCFDLVPRMLAIRLLVEWGLDQGVAHALYRFYAVVIRRIRDGNALGEEMPSISSVAQGGPLSMMLLNALVTLAFLILEDATLGQVETEGFADDTNAIAEARADPTITKAAARAEVARNLQVATDAMSDFADVTKQKLAPSKIFAWATCPALRKLLGNLLVKGQKVMAVKAERMLGAWLNFTGQHICGTAAQRIKTAVQTDQKVACLPGPPHLRRSVHAATAIEQGLYGVQTTEPPRRAMQGWSAAALRVWRGGVQGAEIQRTCMDAFRETPQRGAFPGDHVETFGSSSAILATKWCRPGTLPAAVAHFSRQEEQCQKKHGWGRIAGRKGDPGDGVDLAGALVLAHGRWQGRPGCSGSQRVVGASNPRRNAEDADEDHGEAAARACWV